MSVSRSSPCPSNGKVFDKDSISLYSRLIQLAQISFRLSNEQRQAITSTPNCSLCEMVILLKNGSDGLALNSASGVIPAEACMFNSRSSVAVEPSRKKFSEEMHVPGKWILYNLENNFSGTFW